MSDITNIERFLYIIFTLWCQQNGKDHTKEDFNQIKDENLIPSEDYEKLRVRAIFQILKARRCPSCWEHMTATLVKVHGRKTIDLWSVTCEHCNTEYRVRGTDKTAEVHKE